MNQVTLYRYMELCQRNINEFLKAFFNGSAHSVGASSFVFPDCEIRLGRQQAPVALPKPWIVVEPVPAGKPDDMRSGKTKVRVTRDGIWRFIVMTDYVNQKGSGNWETNDKITSQLSMVLNACRKNLANGTGMKIIKVGVPSRHSDPAIQFSIIQVTIRVEMSQVN